MNITNCIIFILIHVGDFSQLCLAISIFNLIVVVTHLRLYQKVGPHFSDKTGEAHKDYAKELTSILLMQYYTTTPLFPSKI